MNIDAIKYIEKEILDEKTTLGKTIGAFRKCEDITQADFAKGLGISKQYLCDIENNRRNLSPKQAAIFANKVGIPEMYFIQLALQDILDRDGLHYKINEIEHVA